MRPLQLVLGKLEQRLATYLKWSNDFHKINIQLTPDKKGTFPYHKENIV